VNEYRPPTPPAFRPCGRPECRICQHNLPDQPPDSGHPEEESLASLLLGAAAIVVVIALVLFILPVLAS